DSGDGHSSKEEVGVAGYMTELLNNSKLVVKNSCEASKADATVLNIVTVHGMMRECAKLLHSRIRVDLNSDHNLGKAEFRSLCCLLWSLATALRDLGECSFARARRNLLSIGCMISLHMKSMCFFSLVWKIVAWELVSAYAVIEAAELNEMIGNFPENGENSKVDKNKEADLGKRTGKMLALIKERLQSEKKSDVDNSRLLETWVADFLSFLDFSKPGFNEFLLKVKDVVESKSVLKTPKVEEKGLTAETADKIGTFVEKKGHPLTIFSELKQRKAFLENARCVDALNDLESLFKVLDKSKRVDKVVFDLSLARGLDYYTAELYLKLFLKGMMLRLVQLLLVVDMIT
ncbi:histidine-tRNA ligase-like protein, partial [Trifolium pratense]